MKILITGGAGYVGSHVALEALFAGHEVCVFDSFRNSVPKVGDFLCSLGARLIVGDVLRPDDIRAAMMSFRPEVVIHMAGLKSVDESQQFPIEYNRVNVGGTLGVLMAMTEVGCDRIVFSSSAAVYGATSGGTVSESSPLKPESVYGRTKMMCETAITGAPLATSVSLRYFNPVACHPMLPERNAVSLMGVLMAAAVGLRPKIQVFGDDYDTTDGSAMRDFVHVRDVASAHLKAVQLDGRRIYNIGTGKGTTVLGLIKQMEITIGRDLPKEKAPRRPGDVSRCVANCELIHRETGWKATRSLGEMCRDAWETETLRLSSERR